MVIGENFLDMLPRSEKNKIMKHLKSFTPDVLTRSLMQEIGAMRIGWINRAIYNDDNDLIHFEGVGRIIKKMEATNILYGFSQVIVERKVR
jgi:hypothetical protein